MEISKRYSRLRTSRMASFVMIFAGWTSIAVAQALKPPYALFDQATLTGSGNTVTATQIPVVTATGAVVYLSATLQFNVDANGNLTIASGYPQISPAPTLITGGFKTGVYLGPNMGSSGVANITVSGPGVTSGGATEWSLSATPGATGCTYPTTATWFVGSIANNPLAARLSKAGITSTSYSYGLAGSGSTCFPGSAWYSGSIIGLVQNLNTITIVSFTKNSSTDSNVPVDQITYTTQ